MTWQQEDIDAPVTPAQLAVLFAAVARLDTTTRAELAAELGPEPVELLTRLGLVAEEGGRVHALAPEPALARGIADWGRRVRDEAEEARVLLQALPALSATWRASFERDAADYTIDRVDEDAGGWFGWWRYLVELAGGGGGTVSAIVANLDALALLEDGAPGHLGALVSSVRSGGLQVELIVPAEARSSPAAAILSALAGAGARLRVGDTAGWFAVAAGRAALVPEQWGRDRGVAALVVHAPGIVGGLEELFRMRWHAAAEWGEEAPGADPAVELLCLGLSDAEAAARLGLSVRSVRRRVAAAMRRHGVTGRMALAHRLGRGERP